MREISQIGLAAGADFAIADIADAEQTSASEYRKSH